MELLNLRLCRDSLSRPWGFRIQGGSDTGYPPIIQRVFSGSPADDSLRRGDIVKALDNHDCTNAAQREILDFIRVSGTVMTLSIIRGDNQVASMLEEQGRTRIASRASIHSVRPSTAQSFTHPPRGMSISSASHRELPKSVFQSPSATETFHENVFQSPTEIKQSSFFYSSTQQPTTPQPERARKPPPFQYSAMSSPTVQRTSSSTISIKKSDNISSWAPPPKPHISPSPRNVPPVQPLSRHTSTSMIQLNHCSFNQQPVANSNVLVMPQYSAATSMSHQVDQFSSLRRQSTPRQALHSTSYEVNSLNRNTDAQLQSSTWHISTLPRSDRMSYSTNQLYPLPNAQQNGALKNLREDVQKQANGFTDGFDKRVVNRDIENQPRILKINLYDSGNASQGGQKTEQILVKRDVIRPAYPAALSRKCSSSTGNYAQLDSSFGGNENFGVTTNPAATNHFIVKAPASPTMVRQSTTNLSVTAPYPINGLATNHKTGGFLQENKPLPYRRTASISTINATNVPSFKVVPSKNNSTGKTPKVPNRNLPQHVWTSSSQNLLSPVYGSRDKLSQPTRYSKATDF